MYRHVRSESSQNNTSAPRDCILTSCIKRAQIGPSAAGRSSPPPSQTSSLPQLPFAATGAATSGGRGCCNASDITVQRSSSDDRLTGLGATSVPRLQCRRGWSHVSRSGCFRTPRVRQTHARSSGLALWSHTQGDRLAQRTPSTQTDICSNDISTRTERKEQVQQASTEPDNCRSVLSFHKSVGEPLASTPRIWPPTPAKAAQQASHPLP